MTRSANPAVSVFSLFRAGAIVIALCAQPLLAGPAPIAHAPVVTPVRPEVVFHGSRNHKHIALTFDACERHAERTGFDRRIVDILIRTGTPATFFLGGKWMLSHPEETRELARFPIFELANHSHSHPDLRTLDDASLRHQIQEPQNILYRLTGRSGALLRAPFGWYNARVVAAAGALGLKLVQWDVVSGDPDPRVSGSMIKRFIIGGARNGSIAIMHVNGRGHNTHKVLEEIITHLRQRGYRFVTVSEMLGAPR